MASKYDEEIKYLKSIYSRYEREEEQDSLFEEGKYIKNENEKAWNAKHKKMRLLKNIIDALSNETIKGHCKNCRYLDKHYCKAFYFGSRRKDIDYCSDYERMEI
jgi:hypothetical protein